MYTKIQVLNHLEELVSYAQSKGLNRSWLDTMVAGLQVNIASYFSLDIATPLANCIEALVHAGIRGGITYDNYTIPKSEAGKPTAYDDIRAITSFMDTMMGTDGNTFYQYISQSLGDDGVTMQYTSPMVDVWVATWATAVSTTPTKLNAIADFASSYALGNSIKLLVDAPKIKSVPNFRDITTDIYKNKHYEEFIRFYNLGVYIPEE